MSIVSSGEAAKGYARKAKSMNAGHPIARKQFAKRTALQTMGAVCAIALCLGAGAGGAQADTSKPTLVSQVPFVAQGWGADAGKLGAANAVVQDIPSNVNESDIVAWATCDSDSVPSAYAVTKTIDRSTRTLYLSTQIDHLAHDRNCVLNVVALRLGAHIAFYPYLVDWRNGEILLRGEYVIEGVFAG